MGFPRQEYWPFPSPGKKQPLQQNAARKTGHLHFCKRKKLDHLLTPFTKIISETIKLLEENINDMLFDINLSNIFFGYAFSGKGNKNKDKWNYKLKTFCAAKEIINKRKRHPIESEEISSNYIFHK